MKEFLENLVLDIEETVHTNNFNRFVELVSENELLLDKQKINQILCDACEMGLSEFVNYVLKLKKCDPSYFDLGALEIVCENAHIDIFNTLLNDKRTIVYSEDSGIFYYCVKENMKPPHFYMIKKLFEYSEFRRMFEENFNMDLVFECIENNQYELLKFIIDNFDFKMNFSSLSSFNFVQGEHVFLFLKGNKILVEDYSDLFYKCLINQERFSPDYCFKFLKEIILQKEEKSIENLLYSHFGMILNNVLGSKNIEFIQFFYDNFKDIIISNLKKQSSSNMFYKSTFKALEGLDFSAIDFILNNLLVKYKDEFYISLLKKLIQENMKNEFLFYSSQSNVKQEKIREALLEVIRYEDNFLNFKDILLGYYTDLKMSGNVLVNLAANYRNEIAIQFFLQYDDIFNSIDKNDDIYNDYNKYFIERNVDKF